MLTLVWRSPWHCTGFESSNSKGQSGPEPPPTFVASVSCLLMWLMTSIMACSSVPAQRVGVGAQSWPAHPCLRSEWGWGLNHGLLIGACAASGGGGSSSGQGWLQLRRVRVQCTQPAPSRGMSHLAVCSTSVVMRELRLD